MTVLCPEHDAQADSDHHRASMVANSAKMVPRVMFIKAGGELSSMILVDLAASIELFNSLVLLI